ncbi:MAG: OmpA family protein [Mesorhizobium sp.]|nr:OmpA family protein [Mesorhizobium sp.]
MPPSLSSTRNQPPRWLFPLRRARSHGLREFALKKTTSRIIAGTALGLLMASGASFAAASQSLPSTPSLDGIVTGPVPQRVLQLAQTDSATEETEEQRKAREAAEAAAEAAKQPAEAPAEAPAEPPADAAPAEAPAAPAEAPAEAPAAPAEAPAAPAEAPVDAAPAEAPAAPAEAPAEAPAAPAEAPAAPADAAPAEAPAEAPAAPAEAPAAPAEAPAVPAEAPAVAPAAPAEAPAAPTDAPAKTEVENAAPVLDSAKPQPGQKPADGAAQTTTPVAPPADAPPPPATDAAAQADTIKIEDVQPVAAEKGTRVEGERPQRRERPEGTDVLREIGDRVIIEFNNQVIVQSNDRPRMTRGATEVYYEDLPRGRTRETIVRENGVQIVTIRDRYGDVIRRSRITPDGREYVLTYVDEDRRGGRGGEWRDPGLDLQPLVLTIPVSEYILDAERARNSDAYYDFLDQPPVERVQRLYSVDEVKRSARVRDSVRRVDLDTITFEFGSASIAENEVARLDGVATAMQKLLEKNPGETFLIEGHTDAVGSNYANLALSDRRAEAVAEALTNVFDIPPENLVTQGYGEQYLKVATEAPERINRRVAIRRITPLVAPVASAQ